jgi:hypothetical protein
MWMKVSGSAVDEVLQIKSWLVGTYLQKHCGSLNALKRILPRGTCFSSSCWKLKVADEFYFYPTS